MLGKPDVGKLGASGYALDQGAEERHESLRQAVRELGSRQVVEELHRISQEQVRDESHPALAKRASSDAAFVKKHWSMSKSVQPVEE